LAAALESTYDLDVSLEVGHDGIYDVTVDGELVYTKRGRSKGEELDESQIVELVGRHLGTEPGS